MKERLKELLEDLKSVVSSYPLMLCFAFIAALSVGTLIEIESASNAFSLFPFTYSAILGIPLFFVLALQKERKIKYPFYEVLSIAFLIGLYLFLPKDEKDFTEPYRIFVVVLFLLVHLLVSFFCFLRTSQPTSFWNFNKNLFTSAFLTAVFSLVLALGALLALVAVDQLFELEINSKRYAQVFFPLLIIGSAVIFSLFNQKGLEALKKEGSFPAPLKFFTQFILVPLLLLYGVILYFYGIKILFQWELPKGWVSYLILIYSLLGIFALLLVEPLSSRDSSLWVRRFRKLFYFTLIPLLALLYVAIFTRILDYGFTELRYYVLLLALWLSFITLVYILRPNTTIKIIPLSLFLAGVLSLCLPYLNSFSVAKNSQKKELSLLLKDNQLLKDGKIQFSTPIKKELAKEIGDKFGFLAERNELESLLDYLPKKLHKEVLTQKENSSFYQLSSTIERQFTHVLVSDKTTIKMALFLHPKNRAMPLEGFTYAISLQAQDGNYPEIEEYYFKSSVSQDPNDPYWNLELHYNNSLIDSYDLLPFLKKTASPYLNREGTVTVPSLSESFNLGPFTVKTFPQTLLISPTGNSGTEVRYEPMEITILVKKK